MLFGKFFLFWPVDCGDYCSINVLEMRHPNEWYPLQNRTSTSLSYLEGASSWEEITHFCSSDLWWFSFCPILFLITVPTHPGASQVVLVVKNPPVNSEDARDVGLIPVSGRSPGAGSGNPLQCSCLGNPMDRGPWWAIGHCGLQSMGPQRVRNY